MTNAKIPVDVILFGGGIAGLWALNRLRGLGYQAILLENQSLGSGQSIYAQGIIHGGLKYALSGFLSGSSTAIETMPKRWKACLGGTGELPLDTVKILSPDQLLWSTGNLSSEIAGFFASKALQSRVSTLAKNDYPALLKNPAFKGHVYRLEEIVLDMPSLLSALSTPHQAFIFKINQNAGYTFITAPDNPQKVLSLKIFSGTETREFCAQRYIFAAGEGNEQLMAQFPISSQTPLMQRRPLQMVWLQLDTPFPFFAHCIEQGMNPRITITTHPTAKGKTVWYLGGQLAEDGAQRTPSAQIAAAQQELRALFPWQDFSRAEWGSFFVNRAEPAQPGGKRPETVFLKTLENVMVAWPTKLALSPLLSEQLITCLQEQGVQASNPTAEQNAIFTAPLQNLEKPKIARSAWDLSA